MTTDVSGGREAGRMNETQQDFEQRIECHDGWHLYLYAATCFVHDARGVEGVAFSRGADNQIDVPAEDIPALIEALQRFVEGAHDDRA